MTNYQVIKILCFELLWMCISGTELEQRKDASEDTKSSKIDFSFLENDVKHEDWIDPFNMFEYKPSGNNLKTVGSKANQADVNNEDEQSADKIHWQTAHSGNAGNPNEMYKQEGSKSILSDFESQQKPSGVCSKTEKNSCNDEEFIYLKRTANMVQNKLEALQRDSPSTILHVILTITEDAIATLKAFLGSPCKHIQEFDSTIAATLNNAELTESYNYMDFIYNYVHRLYQSEAIIYYIVISIAAIISFNQLLRLSIKQIISRLIIIIFILSFAWNWMLLLKMETASAYAKADTLGPSDCRVDEMGTYKKITLILGSIFFPSNDRCKQYYEAVLVEPIWKVNPLLALSKTFSELCFHPLGLLGQHLGYFFQNLFSAVSWYLLLPVSVIVTIIILLLLLLLFGYRIRLPFFLTIEPGYHQYTREQNQLIADVLEGRVNVQRIGAQTTNANEILGHCSNCNINSNAQKALEQQIKKTSTNEDKGIQTNASEVSLFTEKLTDGKVKGRIQDLETVTKSNVTDNMPEE